MGALHTARHQGHADSTHWLPRQRHRAILPAALEAMSQCSNKPPGRAEGIARSQEAGAHSREGEYICRDTRSISLLTLSHPRNSSTPIKQPKNHELAVTFKTAVIAKCRTIVTATDVTVAFAVAVETIGEAEEAATVSMSVGEVSAEAVTVPGPHPVLVEIRTGETVIGTSRAAVLALVSPADAGDLLLGQRRPNRETPCHDLGHVRILATYLGQDHVQPVEERADGVVLARLHRASATDPAAVREVNDLAGGTLRPQEAGRFHEAADRPRQQTRGEDTPPAGLEHRRAGSRGDSLLVPARDRALDQPLDPLSQDRGMTRDDQLESSSATARLATKAAD